MFSCLASLAKYGITISYVLPEFRLTGLSKIEDIEEISFLK